jgi:hypothetical protein
MMVTAGIRHQRYTGGCYLVNAAGGSCDRISAKKAASVMKACMSALFTATSPGLGLYASAARPSSAPSCARLQPRARRCAPDGAALQQPRSCRQAPAGKAQRGAWQPASLGSSRMPAQPAPARAHGPRREAGGGVALRRLLLQRRHRVASRFSTASHTARISASYSAGAQASRRASSAAASSPGRPSPHSSARHRGR